MKGTVCSFCYTCSESKYEDSRFNKVQKLLEKLYRNATVAIR
jgi:hypothetical protein